MSFLDSVPVISSYRKSKEADEIIEDWQDRHEYAERRLSKAQSASKKHVDELFELKKNCSINVIPNTLNVLEKCQKVNRLETKVSQESYTRLKQFDIPALRQNESVFNEVAIVGAKGVSAGAVLALGSMSTVASLGTASTGTAIASLSGAAAKSATLAWFGGGSLASGGGGIALGSMTLGGIALAPLAILGAIKYSSHAQKKYTQAIDFRESVKVNIEKIDSVIAISKKLNQHIVLFCEVINGVSIRLQNASERLDQALVQQQDQNIINRLKLENILFIKALKRILEVNVLNQNNQPSTDSQRVIEHVSHMSETIVDDFVSYAESNSKVTLPSGMKYLSELEPGVQSARYFWLQGVYKEDAIKSKGEKKDGDEITLLGALGMMFFSFLLFLFSLFNGYEFLFVLSGWFFISSPFYYLSENFGGFIKRASETAMGILTILAFIIYFVL